MNLDKDYVEKKQCKERIILAWIDSKSFITIDLCATSSRWRNKWTNQM